MGIQWQPCSPFDHSAGQVLDNTVDTWESCEGVEYGPAINGPGVEEQVGVKGMDQSSTNRLTTSLPHRGQQC